jgi:hypothetical protein
MERGSRIRLQLVGVTVGVLAALLIWPTTRWLVRAQLGRLAPWGVSASEWPASLAGVIHGGSERSAAATHRLAATMPDDFQAQLAAAVTPAPGQPFGVTQKVANLRELARRFPDKPSVYANILRFATGGPVRVHRDEERLIWPHDSEASRQVQHPSDADQLAAFDRDAAEGERLDQENAYFPLMRAIGLFDAHRDVEALAALHRAAHLPLWQEYYADELEGETRLQERAFGPAGALPRIGIYAAILFPHYSQFRSVGRMATAIAMRAEQAGRVVEGIRIREDVMRTMGMVRAESRTMIGNLVGSAIAVEALQRPGGAPYMTLGKGGLSGGQSERARLLAQYDAFLQRTGHTEQSARAHGEIATATQIREVASHIRSADIFGNMLWRLGLAWWLNVQLLCAAFWTLVLGALAAALYRNRKLRSGAPPSAWMGRGVLLGSLAALASGVVALPAGTPQPLLWMTAVLLFAAAALVLSAANAQDRLRTLAAYAASLVATGVLLMLFAWQASGAIDPTRRMLLLLTSFGEGARPGTGPLFGLLLSGEQQDLLYHFLAVGGAALVPAFAAFAFLIVSYVNGVNASVALVRGFRGCAVPIACALLLAYAATVPITLRLESATDAGIAQTLRHEGRYQAGLAGLEWPGRIP